MSKKKATPDTERFASRKKAHDWLLENGHKVSIGKFYGDCDKGLIVLAGDGSVSKFAVLEYALSLKKDVQVDPGKALDAAEHDRRKAKADADMAEMKAEKMRREEDALWLHADDAWSAVAGLVGRLRDSIRHHLYASQGELAMTAGGEQERSQELFEAMDAAVDLAFNEVAGGSIEVEFGD